MTQSRYRQKRKKQLWQTTVKTQSQETTKILMREKWIYSSSPVIHWLVHSQRTYLKHCNWLYLKHNEASMTVPFLLVCWSPFTTTWSVSKLKHCIAPKISIDILWLYYVTYYKLKEGSTQIARETKKWLMPLYILYLHK